ncbi:MAG: NADPH-dependent oxidoreductase [Armatimonadota bacterium]
MNADEAWSARFGDVVPLEIEELGSFLTHRSVRRFTNDPVPNSLLRGLIGIAASASTSSNLQAWSVVSVRDPERRARLAELVGNQRSVATAPVFLAFLLDLHRLEVVASRAGVMPDGLGTTEMMLTGTIDAALAAERCLVAAEAIGLGGCYIGGLRNHPEAVAELLALPPHTFGLFGMVLGTPDPAHPGAIKPRLRPEALLHEEQYADPTPAHIAEYEARLRAFDQAQRPDAERSEWASQSGRRASRGGMSGRETLRESLHQQHLGLE